MPVIRIDGPRVEDLSRKRQFVKDVTNAAATLYGLPPDIITVLLRENAPENVGAGGQLLIDLHKSRETDS